MASTQTPTPKRLVLCFDGTGNKFSGDESDTNIVKIYEMLDRTDKDQYHYYQPGIGTYVNNQMSNSSTGSVFTRIKSSIVTSIDEAVGTSFVHHVVSGYQFLMRYYEKGDKVYIFGFSRGAYTARFLAEMICNLGLLSRGNEEMVPFAWSTFSDFQRGREEDPKLRKFMDKFSSTYCREKITSHFLGLFDCVNSVGQFELPLFSKSIPYIPLPPAKHIRHAVSINERRLKFKPALFINDPSNPPVGDIKEVWFAGNHGDVGGGWSCDGDNYLLSEIPLRWMIDEVLDLPEETNKLAWQNTKVAHAAKHEDQLEKGVEALPDGAVKYQVPKIRKFKKLVHDVLSFGGGVSPLSVGSWWILEVLPLFSRLELEGRKWVPRYWPSNLGSSRDIPLDSKIHPTVQQLYRSGILSDKHLPTMGGHDSLPEFLPQTEGSNGF